MRHSFQWRASIILLLLVSVMLLLVALSRPSAGQGLPRTPTDPSNGRRIAELMCSSCHIVSPEKQATAVVGVPSFAAIANHAGQSPERLAGAIIIPHPPMPTVSLTNAEMRDIIAYILSLRTDK